MQQRLGPSRRGFLKTSSAIALASGLPTWFVEQSLAQQQPDKPVSANDKPGVLLVGCGGQGRGDAQLAKKFGNIVAICDVDARHVADAAEEHPKAKRFSDFREAMQHPGVDAVITGTPDHWHTLVNIHAMRQGKDVYSEKPLTLTIAEGRKLVDVSKQTQRILQTGTQQRSDPRFRLACELVRNGRIGKLQRVTTILPCGRREGPFKPSPVPETLNWDMWLGQAPKVDYVKERTHLTFRYWYDYSGGTMTDWGAHHNDIARWGMGVDQTGPTSIEGESLIDMIPGGFTAASQYRVQYTYANGVVHNCISTTWDTWSGSPENNPPPDKNDSQSHHGVKFIGTDGWIFVTRGRLEASKPEILSDELPANAERLYVSNNHMGNFFDCMKSRKPTICEPEIGHRSVSVCHLGVLAIRLGRKLQWDPTKEDFVNDAEASSYVSRHMREPWSLDKV